MTQARIVRVSRAASGSARRRSLACGALFGALLGAGGCAGGKSAGVRVPEDALAQLPVAMDHAGAAVVPGGVNAAVEAERRGSARFVPELFKRFEVDRALGFATFADGFYRAPASDGYERVVDRVLADLYAAGFGAGSGSELDILRKDLPARSWTPDSAVVQLVRVDAQGVPIQAVDVVSFEGPSAPSRVVLPINAPGCDLVGALALSPEELTRPGMILLTERRIRDVEALASEREAAGVISSFLFPYCVDPSGREQHNDAIFQDTVRAGTTLPSFYVSPRIARALANSARQGGQVRLLASVRFAARPLRTVVATIVGDERADEVVHVVAHVDGAGANDNAAGAAAMLEGALLIKRLVDSGALPRPRRSLAFVFGQEARAGAEALAHSRREVIAAVVTDMIGTSRTETGAICLLERGYDPGALDPLPPDEHTPWGAGAVAEEDVFGHGLSIILREALLDVAAYEAERRSGAPRWETREHPWEGGSDHDRYLAQGVAACLLWHFTDYSYSTSLDRMNHVDGDELRRTSVAALAGALAVAAAAPGDLERHLGSLNLERQMRLDAVVAAGRGDAAITRWKEWFDGARHWLRAVCLGEPLNGERRGGKADSAAKPATGG